jgi:tetratricopeptide (TPR) repeat protein
MVGPRERKLFALCGVFPSSQIDLPVITFLAGQLGLSSKELGQLANLSLIDWQTAENQIQLHPLIYEYAGSFLADHPGREEIKFHFAVYYATLAKRFYKEIQLLEPELPQLLAAAKIACDAKDCELLQPLWQVVSSILWRLSDWTTYREFDEECLKVAQVAGERHIESRILSELGWVYLEEGKWETADEYFQKAQYIVDDLTSTQHSVRLRRYRAILFTERGQLDKAAVLLAEAEHLVERTSEMALWSKQSREQSLSLIYHAYAGLARAGGDYETALARESQAIEALQNKESYHFRPMFQLQLGDIYYFKNDLEKAGNVWQKIIRHGPKFQPEQRIIAAAFLRMAQIAAFRKNRDRASGWANRARQIYKQSGLAEKMRQASELAEGLEVLMDDPPNVWPAFELWD